ncbi:MAG: hypothetical protein LUD25_05730 [Coriobacteriaceae bacterium]|nr:hypothetical protein [Coriobacteriaceae bacterium]
MRGGSGLVRDERGQMAVEMAVVLPVIFICMVIAIDALVYVAACARFDHLVPQQVLTYASAPAGGETDKEEVRAQVLAALQESFPSEKEEVSLDVEQGSDLLTDDSAVDIYTATLTVTPWPLGTSSMTIFGVQIPTALSHSYSYAIDPFEVGFF